MVSSPPAVECVGVVKRFYHYEHRTTSLREFFVRSVLRRPIHIRRPHFMLTGLDLRVERGESVALVGSNGSGKSTALRLIAGIYAPSDGTVRVSGRVGAVIELGAGFHPELTGIENIRLYGAVLGLTRREIAAHHQDILAFADIGDFIHEPVKYYSSGMQARLAFSVALCVEPDILLLDEVLAVGDESFRARCFERLGRYRANGGTLIIVSHDLATLGDLCSRGVWLDGGRVRLTGQIEIVLEAYRAATG